MSVSFNFKLKSKFGFTITSFLLHNQRVNCTQAHRLFLKINNNQLTLNVLDEKQQIYRLCTKFTIVLFQVKSIPFMLQITLPINFEAHNNVYNNFKDRYRTKFDEYF